MDIFISLLGMLILLLIAFLLSDNKKVLNMRTICGAFTIQFSIGAFVLYMPAGQNILFSISQFVSHITDYSHAGINFMFGA